MAIEDGRTVLAQVVFEERRFLDFKYVTGSAGRSQGHTHHPYLAPLLVQDGLRRQEILPAPENAHTRAMHHGTDQPACRFTGHQPYSCRDTLEAAVTTILPQLAVSPPIDSSRGQRKDLSAVPKSARDALVDGRVFQPGIGR